MAVYKVPQDVEAEDKLIGPFSFRQFIYLMIAGTGVVVGFFLAQVSPLLVAIPLPIILFFGILALPLRKDQPLETYLLAVLRFHLKPRTRTWNPDGTVSYVEITAPRLIEQHLAKGFGPETAQERLNYLAGIMDTRGWSLKGAPAPTSSSVTATVAAEANAAVDVLDDNATLSRSFRGMLAQKDEERRQAAIERMHARQQPVQPAGGAIGMADDANLPMPTYNPYPASMHQKVIQPADKRRKKTKQTQASTGTTPVSPDIISLANNNNLTVSAIAHEAQRLADKDDEIVVQLH